MKLLILTQKVDINDDVLGFFHGWILEFAKHCDKVTVICLKKGKYELPENVKVLSLGKDGVKNPPLSPFVKVGNKLLYILRFYKLIWQHKKEYDYVFVHMNSEYVALGGIFWKIWRKRVILWYNHKYGNYIARIAGYFANNICYTSPFSFFAKNPKANIMPVGIDTDFFKPSQETKKIKNSLLFLGRISPVKKIEILIRACAVLKNKSYDFRLNIVGSPSESYLDKEYYKKICSLIFEKKLGERVNFSEKIPNYLTPEIFSKNEIFINMTNSGSMDKTIFEAMACECIIIACNGYFKSILDEEKNNLLLFKEDDEYSLADKIINLFLFEIDEKVKISKSLRALVVEKHNLKLVVKSITELFKNDK